MKRDTLHVGSHVLPGQNYTMHTHVHRKMEMLNLFVLRFYDPVNPMGSCRARSVYLTTRLLGRLCPLSG